MAKLRDKARQHHMTEFVFLLAFYKLVEMRDPGKDPRRQYVGPPRETVATGILSNPALNKLATHNPRGPARSRL